MRQRGGEEDEGLWRRRVFLAFVVGVALSAVVGLVRREEMERVAAVPPRVAPVRTAASPGPRLPVVQRIGAAVAEQHYSSVFDGRFEDSVLLAKSAGTAVLRAANKGEYELSSFLEPLGWCEPEPPRDDAFQQVAIYRSQTPAQTHRARRQNRGRKYGQCAAVFDEAGHAQQQQRGHRQHSGSDYRLGALFFRGGHGEAWRATRRRSSSSSSSGDGGGGGGGGSRDSDMTSVDQTARNEQQRRQQQQQEEEVFMMKRMFTQAVPRIRLAAAREVYFGEQLRPMGDHIARFKEYFRAGNDTWLVFRHEGDSLDALLYEFQPPEPSPGERDHANDGASPASDGNKNNDIDNPTVSSSSSVQLTVQSDTEEVFGHDAEEDEDEDDDLPMLATSKLWRAMRETPNGQLVAKQILWQILVALEGLHDAGIVHRDIKPSNIILNNASQLWHFAVRNDSQQQQQREQQSAGEEPSSEERLEEMQSAAFEVRIADFSSAADSYTLRHEMFGPDGPSMGELTEEYIAPEVLFCEYVPWTITGKGRAAGRTTGPTAEDTARAGASSKPVCRAEVQPQTSYDMWTVGVLFLEQILGTNQVFSLDQRTQALILYHLRETDELTRKKALLLSALFDYCIWTRNLALSPATGKRGAQGGFGFGLLDGHPHTEHQNDASTPQPTAATTTTTTTTTTNPTANPQQQQQQQAQAESVGQVVVGRTGAGAAGDTAGHPHDTSAEEVFGIGTCGLSDFAEAIRMRDPLDHGYTDRWGLDLLWRMLRWEPEDRISATTALSHAFFRGPYYSHADHSAHATAEERDAYDRARVPAATSTSTSAIRELTPDTASSGAHPGAPELHNGHISDASAPVRFMTAESVGELESVHISATTGEQQVSAQARPRHDAPPTAPVSNPAKGISGTSVVTPVAAPTSVASPPRSAGMPTAAPAGTTTTTTSTSSDATPLSSPRLSAKFIGESLQTARDRNAVADNESAGAARAAVLNMSARAAELAANRAQPFLCTCGKRFMGVSACLAHLRGRGHGMFCDFDLQNASLAPRCATGYLWRKDQHSGWCDVQGRRVRVEDFSSAFIAEGFRVHGVYDGHFGTFAAKYVSRNLHAHVLRHLEQHAGGPAGLGAMSNTDHLDGGDENATMGTDVNDVAAIQSTEANGASTASSVTWEAALRVGFPDRLAESFRYAFQRTHREFVDRSQGHPNLERSGATASVAVIYPDFFAVASVGDSRAVFCCEFSDGDAGEDRDPGAHIAEAQAQRAAFALRDPATLVSSSSSHAAAIPESSTKLYRTLYPGVRNANSVSPLFRHLRAVDVSVDHTPYEPSERRRVENTAEGFIESNGGILRVNGVLAVTRSIGDADFAHVLEYTPDVGVFSIPLLGEQQAQEGEGERNDDEEDEWTTGSRSAGTARAQVDRVEWNATSGSVYAVTDRFSRRPWPTQLFPPFLIIASDGLWDVLTSQEAISLVVRTLLEVAPEVETPVRAEQLLRASADVLLSHTPRTVAQVLQDSTVRGHARLQPGQRFVNTSVSNGFVADALGIAAKRLAAEAYVRGSTDNIGVHIVDLHGIG